MKIPGQSSIPKDAGGKKVSELISADTKIGAGGKVTGTIYKQETMDSFGHGGWFFPVTLDSKYSGQEITVTGMNGPHSAADLEWLVEVSSDHTKVTFATEKEKVFLTLDFSGVTFEESGSGSTPIGSGSKPKVAQAPKKKTKS